MADADGLVRGKRSSRSGPFPGPGTRTDPPVGGRIPYALPGKYFNESIDNTFAEFYTSTRLLNAGRHANEISHWPLGERRDRVTVADVDTVYRTALLGPSGQNDLVHYQTRLKEGLEDDLYTIAMEILAEAAVQGTFTPTARRCLERCYAPVVDDVPSRIAEVLDVLMHDGYIETTADGFRFPSRLLEDWWSSRFRDHHSPLEQRLPSAATAAEAAR